MDAYTFEAIPSAVSYSSEGRVNFLTNRSTATNRPIEEEAPPFVPDEAAGTYPPNVEARDFQPEAGSSAGHSRRRPVVWPVCSGPSTKPTVITFRNATDTAVQSYWVDYDGMEVPYECLQPGHVYRQETYVQHPWVFRDEATHEPFVVGKRALAFPRDSSRSEMIIKRPEALPWTTASHYQFPMEFKGFEAALLLCCNRLTKQQHAQGLHVRCEGAQAAAPPLGEFLAGLPSDVLLVIIAKTAPVQPDIEGVCCF
ncbi:unnamed protein product [Closterium sp. Yama58-4]|nr:unnamed protein product [Closterium sp. Yama58-4]